MKFLTVELKKKNPTKKEKATAKRLEVFLNKVFLKKWKEMLLTGQRAPDVPWTTAKEVLKDFKDIGTKKKVSPRKKGTCPSLDL